MILRQYLHDDPVAVSYLVGCPGTGVAAVVDPVGDPAPYREAAAAGGMELRWVIDTHVHADHLSGGPDLARETSADYVLFRESGAELAHRPVRDGEVLELGNVSLEVVHTPGHTPEHLSLLVTDHTRADEPWAVLTGHTLMVGDMGRTELASDLEEGARDLFRSAERLRGLPDRVEVLPGAYAGSVCGRGLSGKPSSTVGFERKHNRTFGIEDEETFVARMMEEVPPAPPRAREIRAANLGRVASAV